jgi:hypothetical protein
MEHKPTAKPTSIFQATIEDASFTETRIKGTPVIKIKFAIEKIVDPETNQITLLNRTSFVSEVYDKDGKALSDIDLLRLRGCRVEVQVYRNRFVIYSIE